MSKIHEDEAHDAPDSRSKVAQDVLTLYADTLEASLKAASRVATVDQEHGEAMHHAAVLARLMAATFDKGSFDKILARQRLKIAEHELASPEDLKAKTEKITAAIIQAIQDNAAPMDKPKPDGEDPRAVIERIFGPSLEATRATHHSINGLDFGRLADNRPWGLYEVIHDHPANGSDDATTSYAVLVACAGDAHITPATDTAFKSREDANEYIVSNFNPLFSSFARTNPEEARRVMADFDGIKPTLN